MTVSPVQQQHPRTDTVEDLFDGLVRFGRSLRARSADWGHAVRDLTRGDIVTLGVLERRGPIRPGQVAATLGVDPSVVSRQLATLDRLALITRGTDPEDGRAELIGITPLGRDRLRQARSTMCQALADRLGGWDEEQIARATAVVEDLATLLDKPLRIVPSDHPADTTDTTHGTNTEDTHA